MTAQSSTIPLARAEDTAHANAGRTATVLAILLAIVIALLMRWPLLNLPLERDEGAYAYVAQLWLHGGLPYRDAFDHKPPLIYALYMPPLLLTPDAFAIRAWISLLFCLQIPLLWAIARMLWDRPTATIAILLYAVAGSSFSLQGMILNTEQALVLPSLLALWALMYGRGSTRYRWSLLYGIGLGLVTLIKRPLPHFLSHSSYSAQRKAYVGGWSPWR